MLSKICWGHSVPANYNFLVHAIPTLEPSRPNSLSWGLPCGRSLKNFLLSAHLLEVETGRYIRQEREQRFCQACKRSSGFIVLGDEQHTLSLCVKASGQRQTSFAKILSLFPSDSLRHIRHNSLFDIFAFAEHLTKKSPNPGVETVCERYLDSATKHPQ